MEYYEISNYSKQTILQRGKFATLINLNWINIILLDHDLYVHINKGYVAIQWTKNRFNRNHGKLISFLR